MMRWIFAMLASRIGIDARRLAAVGAVGQHIICRPVEHRRAAAGVEHRMAAGVAVAAKGITSAIIA